MFDPVRILIVAAFAIAGVWLVPNPSPGPHILDRSFVTMLVVVGTMGVFYGRSKARR